MLKRGGNLCVLFSLKCFLHRNSAVIERFLIFKRISERLRRRYCPSRFVMCIWMGGQHPPFCPSLSGRLIDPLSVGLPQENSLRPQKKTTRRIQKWSLPSIITKCNYHQLLGGELACFEVKFWMLKSSTTRSNRTGSNWGKWNAKKILFIQSLSMSSWRVWVHKWHLESEKHLSFLLQENMFSERNLQSRPLIGSQLSGISKRECLFEGHYLGLAF